MDASTNTDIASGLKPIPANSLSGVILYQAHITPSSRKVRMFLAEKNLSLKMQDVTEGFGLSKEYIVRYPHAVVPMLELDDGTQLGEALAICRYIEELIPDPPLFGTSARDRAVVDMWEKRAYLEGANAVEDIFRNSHPLMVDRGLAGTSEPVPQIPALVARGHGRLLRFYEKIDQRLSENLFVAGPRFSIADISTLCAIDFGSAVQIDMPEKYKNLHRWHKEVSSRASAAA